MSREGMDGWEDEESVYLVICATKPIPFKAGLLCTKLARAVGGGDLGLILICSFVQDRPCVE